MVLSAKEPIPTEEEQEIEKEREQIKNRPA